MAHDLLVAWLNDAHTMEQTQLHSLERYIRAFDRHPDIHHELSEHVEETKQQIIDLRECIGSLGGKIGTPSNPQSMQTDIADKANSSPYHDELVKHLQVLHAAEHLEHITYLAIAEAARQDGEHEIADICERIAEEEAAMAEWVEEQIPVVVTSCINTVYDHD